MLTSKLVHHQRIPEAKYPCLMEDRGLVVLFTKDGCGTVIAIEAGTNGYTIGYFSEKWSCASFTPYYGEVVILAD